MNRKNEFSNIDALILCGGQGTRLGSVLGGKPKSLAPFGETAFLDLLMQNLSSRGFERIILCTGHLKDQVRRRYGEFPNVVFSEEDEPLGTGGAVKNAEKLIASENFLAMNGDSVFVGLDLAKFYEFHLERRAPISIALAAPRTGKDFGTIRLAKNDQIEKFFERSDPGQGSMMNGGVYFMNKSVLGFMPEGKFSLEYDFFPRFAGGSLYGFLSSGEVLDIGTPERYERAKTVLS